MHLASLPPQTLDCIRHLRYDRIIEKHEGPERWSSVLKYYNTDFLVVEGRHVLLPIPGDQLPNVTILRCIVGDNDKSLTLFLKDTTFVPEARDEALYAGFIAICDKMPKEDFYIAIVYHEWFMSAPHKLD